MDARQFLSLIIKPSLRSIGLQSVAAEQLLLGTALHESGGLRYIKQINGPALGIYQMEPATYKWLMGYIDDRFANSNLHSLIRQSVPRRFVAWPEAAYMSVNMEWATIVARLFYYSKPQPLPPAGDLTALARYYKRYWNTEKGKADPQDFMVALNPYLAEWPLWVAGPA